MSIRSSTCTALLFSATFKRKVERLARDILCDPIRVVQGDVGEANEDVTQYVEVFKRREDKWPWLSQRLVGFTSTGSVLIFVTRKDNSEELSNNLKKIDMKGLCVLCHLLAFDLFTCRLSSGRPLVAQLFFL